MGILTLRVSDGRAQPVPGSPRRASESGQPRETSAVRIGDPRKQRP